eukprot:TRINITY_DN3278_c0_g1_i9.p1 TRINITY_DN3278_c0_g1~~TRINITY_DN3278_c0_g1_i9.p1  ORF type:complete len:491 (-),score=148.64 TRINITY_DN3278_c0_g1_i9:82-1554(-)
MASASNNTLATATTDLESNAPPPCIMSHPIELFKPVLHPINPLCLSTFSLAPPALTPPSTFGSQPPTIRIDPVAPILAPFRPSSSPSLPTTVSPPSHRSSRSFLSWSAPEVASPSPVCAKDSEADYDDEEEGLVIDEEDETISILALMEFISRTATSPAPEPLPSKIKAIPQPQDDQDNEEPATPEKVTVPTQEGCCPLPEGECLMCMRDVPPCLSSRSPSWSAIMHVVLFSLHHCHPERTYFNLQSDIYPLVDYHWANLFSQKTNVHNWHKQLQDSMSHKRKLFQSGKGNMRKNGYWRLRTLKDPWTAGDHVLTQPRTASPTPTSSPSSSSSSSPSSSPEVFTFAGSTDSPSSSRRTNFTSRVPVRRLSFDHNDLAQTKKRRLSIPSEAADTETYPSASASALTVLQQGILHTTATLSDTLRTLQRDMQTATEANEEMLAGGLALLSSARRDAVAHASDVISYSQELTRKHQDDFCKLWQNIEQTHVVS